MSEQQSSNILGSNNVLLPGGLTEIIWATFRIYVTNFKGFLIISAIVEIPLFVVGLIYSRVALSRIKDELDLWMDASLGLIDMSPEIALNHLISACQENMITLLGFGLIIGPIWLIATSLRIGALIHAIAEQTIRKPISVNRAYGYAIKFRLKSLVIVSFVIFLLILLAALPVFSLIGIPVVIYLAVRWNFIFQIIVLEGDNSLIQTNKRFIFSRSSILTSDSWWKTFIVLLAIFILGFAINMLFQYTLGLIPIIGGVIISTLLAPLFLIGQTLLYFESRSLASIKIIEGVALKDFNIEVLRNELKIH